MHTYNELRVRLERDASGSYRVYATGPSGEAVGSFELPFEPLELENFVLKMGGARRGIRGVGSPQTQLVTDFGGRLFDALFRSRVRDLYRDSMASALSEEKGLRLSLSLSGVPELMHLPWEYLYDEPQFLSISTSTPVIRYLDLPRGRRPPAVVPPLRILAMVSSPTDAPALDVAHERSNLEQAVGGLVERGAVEVEWLEQASLLALQEKLQGGPYHVFHYIGHGAYDHDAGDGMLLLEDENELGQTVTGGELGTILYDHTTLRLAVLNACEGARSSSMDPFAGVACSLVQRQIPAVIAMQFEITDRAAIVFARGFYRAVALGYPVDAALAEARKSIYAARNPIEWATPVLFMRVPDGRIFDLTALPPLPPVPETVPVVEPEEPEPLPAAAPVQPPPVVRPPAPVAAPEPKPDQLVPVHRSRRFRPAWLVAGLAGAAAAVALGVFLAGGGDGGGETTGTVGGGGGPVFAWSSAAAVPGAFGGSGHQEMQGVAAVGSNDAVAVGYDEARGRRVPAAWTYDSSEWTRELDARFGDIRLGAASVGTFYGVAAQGRTVVAVGAAGPIDAIGSPEQDALVWTFSDGSWRRVCREACGNSVSGGGGLGQAMYAIVHRRGGGFVAVGYDVSDEDTRFDAAVWTSPDGLEWSRVPADAEVFGGPRDQVMRAVTETRSGLLVAVGWNRRTGAVWTSPNGRAWRRVGVDAFGPLSESGFLRLNDIIEEGNRLVVVGLEIRGQGAGTGAAAWVSNGGPGEWQRIETSAFSRDGFDQPVLGGAATGHGTVAVGYDRAVKNENKAAVAWLFASGTVRRIETEVLRGPGDREINAAAVLADGRLLAVGDGPSPESDASTEQDARVWIARPRR